MARAYTQDLLDRASAYVTRSLGAKRSPEGLAALASLYADVTGEPVGSCRQCQYSDFVHSLTSYIREATRFLHPETMAETTYQIIGPAAGETFVHPSWNKAVTSDNLTDKDAEFFIKHGYADTFVRKDGSTAGAKAEDAKTADSEAVSRAKAATTKAEESLKTEKAAHGDTKKKLTAAEKHLTEGQTKLATAEQALTAEKAAHEVTKQQVSDLQAKLTKAQADLAEATKPTE